MDIENIKITDKKSGNGNGNTVIDNHEVGRDKNINNDTNSQDNAKNNHTM